MGFDVFISHSSKDKAIADGRALRWKLAGIRCWIAPATSCRAPNTCRFDRRRARPLPGAGTDLLVERQRVASAPPRGGARSQPGRAHRSRPHRERCANQVDGLFRGIRALARRDDAADGISISNASPRWSRRCCKSIRRAWRPRSVQLSFATAAAGEAAAPAAAAQPASSLVAKMSVAAVLLLACAGLVAYHYIAGKLGTPAPPSVATSGVPSPQQPGRAAAPPVQRHRQRRPKRAQYSGTNGRRGRRGFKPCGAEPEPG